MASATRWHRHQSEATNDRTREMLHFSMLAGCTAFAGGLGHSKEDVPAAVLGGLLPPSRPSASESGKQTRPPISLTQLAGDACIEFKAWSPPGRISRDLDFLGSNSCSLHSTCSMSDCSFLAVRLGTLATSPSQEALGFKTARSEDVQNPQSIAGKSAPTGSSWRAVTVS